MGDFDKDIVEQINAGKTSKTTTSYEEKISQAKKTASYPFKKIKASIKATMDEKQFQEDCKQQYTAYMSFANNSKHPVGTVQSLKTDAGQSITIVYTDNGPIIRTEYNNEFPPLSNIQYEGLITQKIDGAYQLIYSKITCIEGENYCGPAYTDYSGFVQGQKGFEKVSSFGSSTRNPLFNKLERTFDQAYEAATMPQVPEA